MHVFALDDHAFGRRHGGFDGGWGVGLGEAMEAADVVLVGSCVGGIGEDEEVVCFLLESGGIAGWDYCVVLVSYSSVLHREPWN